MHTTKRLIAIIAVFITASLGWLILAGITSHRKDTQSQELRSQVQSLWGTPQIQHAPSISFHWTTLRETMHTSTVEGLVQTEVMTEEVEHTESVAPASSNIDVTLNSDLRRKGLVWYSLYDVNFGAHYRYVHASQQVGEIEIEFELPDSNGIYDDFRVVVDGVDRADDLDAGEVITSIRVVPGQTVEIVTGYASRGLNEWRYNPSTGAGRLRDFKLSMTTDFEEIDFPYQTLSPSSRARTETGWNLHWEFEQLVSGYGIGMVTPSPIQPGELASSLAASAPVSLFFFFLVLFVFSTLKGIDLHPFHYLLIAGAFFAFHLLFAYSVDHLSVQVAFALCSAVSITLVVSYLRLVVSTQFAFREAGLAQLIYLVGFSLAHFWEGLTGLTVTVLSIVTLFALMQLTGRVSWSDVFKKATQAQAHSSTGS